MEGSPHGGKKKKEGQVASGKDQNSLTKTHRVWHEEKADNYLYWLKPASQHKKTENYGWINSQLEREGCRAKDSSETEDDVARAWRARWDSSWTVGKKGMEAVCHEWINVKNESKLGNSSEKRENIARNLSERDESHSNNENDRWVFDHLLCNILEEAGLGRSISRQSCCLCTRTHFRQQKLGGQEYNSGWMNVKKPH